MIDQRNSGMRSRILAVAAALTLYAVWTCATWLLEVRIETLLRPESALDRVAYAVIANMLIGVIVAIAVLRLLISWRSVETPSAGFPTSGSQGGPNSCDATDRPSDNFPPCAGAAGRRNMTAAEAPPAGLS